MTLRIRRLTAAVALVVVAVTIAVSAYLLLRRASIAKGTTGQSAEQRAAPIPLPMPPATPSVGTPARGEVAIDPRRQQLIGVRTVAVERGTLSREIRAVGLVRYDETRLADVNLKVEAWIRTLHVDYTGQFVRKGEPLFTIYSPDLLATQQEYRLALKARDRLAGSPPTDTSHYADRLVDSARLRLTRWDLGADQIRALEQGQPLPAEVLFRSPVTGFVIEKRAVQGMHVMPGESLYRVADLSVVWIETDVYEQDLAMVRRGTPATVTLDAYPGEDFRGRAIYIYPAVDEKTRTAKVRVELQNRDGRLKPGMFANVALSSAAASGLTVPADAVLDSGREQVVFVATGDGHFDPRRVVMGQRLADRIEIRDGLKEGELVATGATFFLDSESQLRASLQGFEPAATGAGTVMTTATPAASAATQPLQITFRSQPDPPKAGENRLEVVVKTPDGKPMTDAAITVAFSMAAMPTMNMPAMRNETMLQHAGGGVYRGAGTIMMAGRWEVSVIVSRGGQRRGTKSFAVVTR